MNIDIRQGDVLDVLRTMPSESVHCVITSPPYFGLRDYGTALWDGGDSDCQHKPAPTQGQTGQRSDRTFTAVPPYKQVCGKCGATRIDKQIGLEDTPDAYLQRMVEVFREVRRVLRSDGTCWVNMGDSYAGGGTHNNAGFNERYSGRASQIDKQAATDQHKPSRTASPGLKPKDLLMMPARLALALQADGWWLRSDIIWCKRAPMPESVTDRPTSAHEHIFLLTKAARYFYDADAVREQFSTSLDDYNKGAAAMRDGRAKHQINGSRDGYSLNAFSGDRNPAGRNLWNYWLLSPEPFSDWGETSRSVPVSLGDVSDGTMHKVRADCPVHGGQRIQVSTPVYGQRVGGASSHTERTDADPVQGPQGGSVPTDPHHVEGFPAQSSDLQGQQCLPFATDHSNGTSKKGHAPVTSPAYTPFAQTLGHTDGKSTSPAAFGSAGHIPANSKGAGGSGVRPQAQTPDRIVDSSSLPIPPECICSFYHVITEKTSHFAASLYLSEEPPGSPTRFTRLGAR